MAFRGYFALNQVEIANSSRVVAHLGSEIPLLDAALFGATDTACGLTAVGGHPHLYTIPASSVPVAGHTGLYTPPNGSHRYSDGLFVVDDACWGPGSPCVSCRSSVLYDDSWPGLKGFLGDTTYRLELAPWYSTRVPESAEFAGVWVLDVKGLGPTPVQRVITEMMGDGASAGPHRDTSRAITFDALLLACTNAGLEYGLEWLACHLRETRGRTDSVLRYLSAHPGHSDVDPDTLVREVHGVVYTKEIEVQESHNPSATLNQQATMYRVQWGMTALSPYGWMPEIPVEVEWDTEVFQPIEWVHAADCDTPLDCDTMPVLFSDTCRPEAIAVVTVPPPVCGGCMPVCEVDTYTFTVPTMDTAIRCRETAANITITNTGEDTLTLQAEWAKCHPSTGCANSYWPLQVSGLPPAAALVLDAITGRYWAMLDNVKHRVMGIVSTPNGAPWVPPIIDRHECWQLVVTAPGTAEFTVEMSLADREA